MLVFQWARGRKFSEEQKNDNNFREAPSADSSSTEIVYCLDSDTPVSSDLPS